MKAFGIIFISVFLLFSCNEAQTKDSKTNSELSNVKLVSEIDTVLSFQDYDLNKLPKDWSQYYTGKKGEDQNWQIINDNGNKALAQLTKNNPNRHYNEVVFDGFKIKDCELSVKLKAISGKMDQGGGFVWRFINANNYYVVRANPLEDNVVLYKVENGKRTDLPLIGKGRTYGADVNPLGNGWNNLKVKVKANVFTVLLNKKEIFKVKDNTFNGAGKVGFWTKSDAKTMFKGFRVKSI